MEPPGGEPPEVPAPPSGDSRLTTERLYSENWQFVFQLLPTFGVHGQDQEDVAQNVWKSVHTQIATYEPDKQSPRAWITGFVRRCASNYRRRQRRKPEMPMEEPGVLTAAPGLNPEEIALLRTLHQAIPDEDRREALVLQVRHGLTVDEIAAATGVSKGKIEWRLQMAKEELNDKKGEKATDSFLGFGSLEALAEALRPAPIPFDRGARLWIRVAEAIRHPSAGNTSRTPPRPKPSPKLGAFVAGSFLSGAAAGAIVLALWQTHGGSQDQSDKPPPQAPVVVDTPVQGAPLPSPVVSALPAPTASTAPTAPTTASLSSSSSPSPAPPPSPDSSERMILRMRRGAELQLYVEVLELVELHARLFPVQQADERESLRIRALLGLDRRDEAEERARREAAQHPERRDAMERAIGHRLP